MRMQPRRDIAQESEFSSRLDGAMVTADSLITPWPKRPTWSGKAILGLLQRATYAGSAVAILHKGGCYPDMATVARVAFESTITALHILHDPEPHQRARQYTDVMLYTQLANRRGDVRKLGIRLSPPELEGRCADEWIRDQVDRAKAECDPQYRDSGMWKVRSMCEGLGLERLYLRCYRPLCAYAHPDPVVLHRLGPEPLGAPTSDDWHLTAIMGLAVTAGCLEVLNYLAGLSRRCRGSKMLCSAWPEVESFVESVFPPGAGRLLGPPPAHSAPAGASAS